MKIKVEELESRDSVSIATAGKLEMVRFQGGIINIGGRTLPF